MKSGMMVALMGLQATQAFASIDCGGNLGRLGQFVEFTIGSVCGGQIVNIQESTNELRPLLKALGIQAANTRYELTLFASIGEKNAKKANQLLDETFSDEYVIISEIGGSTYQQVEVKDLHVTATADPAKGAVVEIVGAGLREPMTLNAGPSSVCFPGLAQ